MQVQTPSVTVTPSGHGKSVTVTNCHCKQMCFFTKFLVWELPKESLYPVCHCKRCNCNPLGLFCSFPTLITVKVILLRESSSSGFKAVFRNSRKFMGQS